MPQHHPRIIIRDLIITIGIIITFFIITILNSRGMVVDNLFRLWLFHKVLLARDLFRVLVSPRRGTLSLVELIRALSILRRSLASPRLNREIARRIGNETSCRHQSIVTFAVDTAVDHRPLILGRMKTVSGHSQHHLQWRQVRQCPLPVRRVY
jgi:hypothetical protein